MMNFAIYVRKEEERSILLMVIELRDYERYLKEFKSRIILIWERLFEQMTRKCFL